MGDLKSNYFRFPSLWFRPVSRPLGPMIKNNDFELLIMVHSFFKILNISGSNTITTIKMIPVKYYIHFQYIHQVMGRVRLNNTLGTQKKKLKTY